jgi:hypothetical protein
VPVATDEPRAIPRDFVLGQNYPNPFNPSTRIEYSLPTPGHVALDVFNVLGERVTTLVDARQDQGANSVLWNSTDALGKPLSSGPYFYQLLVDGKPLGVKKMLLIK